MGVRDGLPWLLDEYWIVGDLWLRRGRTVGTGDPEVVAIASLLGRSPSSVSRRVGNFAGTDQPGKGLKPLTGEPLRIWESLRGNPAALARAVAQARSRLTLLNSGFSVSRVGAGVRIIAPELPNTEPVAVTTQETVREAKQAEAELREQFRVWRDPKGQRLRGIAIKAPESTLRVDLYDQSINLLIEVKATTDRDLLRFAVGQLYDYRRYLDFEVDLAILLPSRPNEDLMGLLEVARIGAIWRDGTSFTDSQDGHLLRS
ncbi:hypothetical protein GCM10010112_43220 [Actinoplanes lobatus]|uniref:Uncharacterized protein n=1 Tax=Actinoplanes lobatus TaxID=113568 RepID=A0A7W7HBT0_9ACTN|nr:hypothetical protein [Actinoplanes lobatus]MBB4747638.1 hypothetical protein [Actinoplanes lobatus]GGN73689.1 hypothetical protein GCM10010112_43220 [Actinoplanes lobatus]GIE39800.1 hypothetical protein Alo02nite_26980 [Actinoplanes lobatus]